MTAVVDAASVATHWWTWVGMCVTIAVGTGAKILRERSRRETLVAILKNTQPGTVSLDLKGSRGQSLLTYQLANVTAMNQQQLQPAPDVQQP